MQHVYLRGILASALGGGIGTIAALSLGLLWPLGALLGGLVGFLAYNVPEALDAIPRVWRVAKGISIFPSRAAWTGFGWMTLGMLSLGSTLMIAFESVCWLSQGRHFFGGTLGFSLWAGTIIVGATAIITGTLLGFSLSMEEQGVGRDLAKHCNIVSLIYHFVRGVVWVIRRFIPLLLREVYSDERLVVGVSALAGALTGYRHASIIEGILCAAVLWSVQYYAITVPLKKRLSRSRS